MPSSKDTTFQQGDRKPHLPALDGLRALAIVMVLFAHGVLDLPRSWFAAATAGWCGVDLFFVLSGYLITRGLLTAKGSSNYFLSFYGKRLLRIFPVYYLTLLVYFVLLPALNPGLPVPVVHDQPIYWLYLSNWSVLLTATNNAFTGHFWSLAVEEQFYLLWPAVVLLTGRRTLAGIAAACIVAAPLLRTILVLQNVGPEIIYRNTFCRIDALMLGALCALALASGPVTHRLLQLLPRLALASALFLALPWFFFGYKYTGPGMIIGGYTFINLGFAGLLLCCILAPARFTVLSWRPLRFIGLWSYGIYVYHLGFFYLAHSWRWLGVGRRRFAVEVSISIAAAAFSFTFYEQPMLSLKRRFEARWEVEQPSRSRQPELAIGS